MERKCASNWSSIDAIGEESEMIAHLQSMFWSSSDVDLNLCSSNASVSSGVPASTVPSSLFLSRNNEGYCTMPLVNTSMDMGFDHQFRTFISTNEAVVADRRMFKMDEKKNPNKKLHTVPSALTRAGSSSILNGVTNTKLVGQSFSCCSSEEDSIGTTEKSVVLNRTDKSRARKRSSKNSQSIYAKKRRERISERLKILQKLIPNGTKVDISTMLEDAVHYVKFLQLQIKLLSSDEMWMFAPLAYNGINVCLDLNTSPRQE